MRMRAIVFFIAVAVASLTLMRTEQVSAAPLVKVTATLTPGAHTVSTATIDLTKGGMIIGNILGGVSNANPVAMGNANGVPDDATINAYVCDGGPSTTLVIPTPALVFNAPYPLPCPSPGGIVNPLPAGPPPAGGASLLFTGLQSVGGLAQEVNGGTSPTAASSGSGGGSAAIYPFALAGAAVILALAAGGWYARRRWLR